MLRLALILIVVFISTPSYPQVAGSPVLNGRSMWQKNGMIICDSQGRSIRQNAKILSLEDGSSVIVWEDARNGFTDIYAQRMSSTGTKLWGIDGIPLCKASKNQAFPQMIHAGDSGVIVVWQDYREGFSDIYAQKLDLKGNLLWQSDGLPVCKAASNQLAPQLASDGAGGAIITWYDYRSGKGEDVYAQRINSSGTNEWQLDGVPVCLETATQWYPQIISDGSGGSYICWEDKRSGYYDIYAQKLDPEGTPVWQLGGIAVCAAPENQQYCQIASCEGNSFVVTWQDYRNGNADIYAQKLDVEGKMFWKTNGEVICNVPGNQEKPQIIGGESPVIFWTDFRNGTGNSDIFSQKISSLGKPVWNQYGMAICEAPGNQSNPKGVTDGDGGAIIVWQDQRSTSSSGIFARRITSDGKALWAPDGKTICNSISNSEFPQISASKDRVVTIVWNDKRYGGLDLFAQSINPVGNTLWKNSGIDVCLAYGSVTQQKPRITKSGKSEYIVAFEDYRNGYSNIYTQKINNSGRLLWSRDGIKVCNAQSDQLNPEIICDDDGGSIIVWEDTRHGFSCIYAQRIDAYGNRLWDENGIMICQAEGEKTNPRVIKDGKNGAIIAWQDTRNKSNLSNVFVQRIDKNGSLLWRIDGVPVSNSEGVQNSIKAESDGEGGIVITWVEYKRNINTPDIFAQRISGSGMVIWEKSGLAVCRAPEAQRNTQMDVGESIIIVWEDSGGGNYDIYAQKISKDGKIIWVCDGIPVCTAPYTQHEPQLILNDDGGATIAWEDYRNANWDIYIQRIDPLGEQVWNKDGVAVSLASGTQYSPQIVRSKARSAIIVWEDYRNNKSYNIYAQKISGSGEALWEKDGLPVCFTDGGARSPQVVDDGEDGAIILWTDYRYGNYDIYAQRINEVQGK